MTANTKRKLGGAMLIVATVVNLLNIVLKNYGTPIKFFGLPLFFIGLLVLLSAGAKNDKDTQQDS
jgi:hypothetical protein